MREVAPSALVQLGRHAWPGNLRELRATLERALLEAGGGPIRASHLRLDAVVRPGAALKLNARQLALMDGLQPGQTVRAGEHAQSTGVSPATAWRDLTDLVEKGLLEAQGKGRGAAYRLPAR